ncbi:MAG TPA: glycosyltransferase, partial [Vicinamibacterales bacterium]|nr:glycosyltransferase [Vicinamibacterales bacterium]
MPRVILHILGTAQPEGTSIARMMSTLGSFLDPAYYRLHAWFLGDAGPLVDVLRSSGIAAESVPWRYGARDPAGMFRFFRASQGTNFALVHQHFGGRSVRRLARWLLRSPIIVHLHGRIDETAGVVSPVAIADAEAVIAVSRAVSSNVLGTRPDVVYPGIAAAGGEPPARTMGSAGIVIGTATRLVSVKGLGYLLHAFAALRKRHTEVRLEIAGAGGEERALRQLAHDLGIANAVSFLGWRV